MNNPDQIFIFIFFGVKIIKLFDADPRWKKFGSEINILDPQHWLNIHRNTSVLDPGFVIKKSWSRSGSGFSNSLYPDPDSAKHLDPDPVNLNPNHCVVPVPCRLTDPDKR
jgi:hypothetical protein